MGSRALACITNEGARRINVSLQARGLPSPFIDADPVHLRRPVVLAKEETVRLVQGEPRDRLEQYDQIRLTTLQRPTARVLVGLSS